MIDLLVTTVCGILAAPLMLLIAVAIKLESPGPVFYAQRRIGRGGGEFRAWKFRSMIANADMVLKKYLDENPMLKDEWERTQKLKDDPRVTALGRFLRRCSLDELPQLWNVLRGEMSLVGPRPIVRDEIKHYGLDFETYTYVQGGLTGLWQVSGRSETSYQQRVDFDRFYVQNWSVWLDLCILFRTIGTVLSRAGAF
jgi:Undecaprenyl-phosphate galactose phosphotransferase WbaP